MKTKRLTRAALLTAIALTIFMVEAQLPALAPVPGIKLGLANILWRSLPVRISTLTAGTWAARS